MVNYLVTIVQPNGDTVIENLTEEPKLEQLQKWVGGYVEVHRVQYGGDNKSRIFMNEEGVMRSLPPNAFASGILRASGYPATVVVYGPVAIVEKHNVAA